jgi:ribonuclease BN (tRNA processing enzyme)
MRIITVGTSHGDHTKERFNSSILLQAEDRNYIVDAGAPITGKLARLGIKAQSIKAIFISHMHNDHVGDLPGVLKALIKYPETGQHASLFLPEQEADIALDTWLCAIHLDWPSPLVSVEAIKDGKIYDDGLLAVNALATEHIKAIDGQSPGSFAFSFKIKEKLVVYTGDLSCEFSDFPASLLEGACDALICETQHYDLDKAIPFLASLPVKKMIFTHIADRWHGDGEALLEKKISLLPFPAYIAHDGDEFEI